jgi:hypothetical protein
MDVYEAGILIGIFTVCFLVLYFTGLVPFAILLGIVLVDKVLLCQLQFQGHLGIELQTVPTVLTGIIYGPVAGFFFGFLVLTLMDFFTMVFAPPTEMEWIPGLPSYNSTIYGIIAVIAWYLYPGLGLISIIVIVTIVKGLGFMLKDFVVKGVPNVVAAVINTLLNFVLMRVLVSTGFTKFLGL